MLNLPKSQRAVLEFALRWQSGLARHCDRLYVDKADFYRDIFPGTLDRDLALLEPGQSCSTRFEPGVLVPRWSERGRMQISRRLLDDDGTGAPMQLEVGRFYPQGVAWRGLSCFRGDRAPFRLLQIEGDTLLVDSNHPLAAYPLELGVVCLDRLASVEERGGSCHDLAELVCGDGPGMQVPFAGHSGALAESCSEYPYTRLDEGDDRLFYAAPRMVHHLDAIARRQVSELYGRLVPAGADLLDLMGSWDSHLPDALPLNRVAALGLNSEELSMNPRLREVVVHDLNEDTALPFPSAQFDAVICTASIEYLIRPREVVTEVARVLRPGGKCIVTFSDRWFPGKEIRPWAALHPFERLGLVLDFIHGTGLFEDLQTETVRGYPRPMDDPHWRPDMASDPVFALWGTRRHGK